MVDIWFLFCDLFIFYSLFFFKKNEKEKKIAYYYSRWFQVLFFLFCLLFYLFLYFGKYISNVDFGPTGLLSYQTRVKVTQQKQRKKKNNFFFAENNNNNKIKYTNPSSSFCSHFSFVFILFDSEGVYDASICSVGAHVELKFNVHRSNNTNVKHKKKKTELFWKKKKSILKNNLFPMNFMNFSAFSCETDHFGLELNNSLLIFFFYLLPSMKRKITSFR